MQPYARSLISHLAVSLCVLCAFAVNLRFAGSNQHRARRGFLAKGQTRKGQARNGLGLTNCLEIHLLELPKYAPLDDNPPIADLRDPPSKRKTAVPPWKKFAPCIESLRLSS